jgi:cell division septation protein DedD
MNRSTSALVALVGAAVVASGLVPGAIVAEHGADSTDFTVSTDSSAENASEVTYVFDVQLTDDFGDANSGFSEVTGATFTIPAGSVGGCQDAPVENLQDYSLTVTESGGQESFENVEATFEGGTASFDIGDGDADYRVNEKLVLELDACVTNPEERNWYQADVLVEGKSFGDGQDISLGAASHYYPICEGCDNESSARDELGAKPSEPTPTPTPEPTPTPTPVDPDDDPTPTPTEEPASTPTEPDDDSTSTPTDDPTETGGGAGQRVFGMDPLVVVGFVGAVSVGIAVFGATRL